MDQARPNRTTALQQRSNNKQQQRSRHGRKTGAQVSLNNCDDVLCFLEEFGVLVCKDHRTGVVNLDTHLLQHHHVPAATRREIVERFRHYTLTEPNDVELPDEPAMPIEELGAPVDALQCRTCALVTVSKDKLRQHCKKDHQQAWTGEKSSLYKTVKV